MSSLRTTLGSVLSVIDRGGASITSVFDSAINSLDMLNARIASAKIIQAQEIEEDEIYRLKEIEFEADERMTALVERSEILASTKPEALAKAHAYLEEARAARKAAKAKAKKAE